MSPPLTCSKLSAFFFLPDPQPRPICPEKQRHSGILTGVKRLIQPSRPCVDRRSIHRHAGPTLHRWGHTVFTGFGCIFGHSPPSPSFVPCSVLSSSLPCISVLKIRSNRKVVKMPSSTRQTWCLFFSLFAYLVCSSCACETDNLVHGTTVLPCPPLVPVLPPWTVLCLLWVKKITEVMIMSEHP